MKHLTEIQALYKAHFRAPLEGRYIRLEHLFLLLEELQSDCKINIEGYSEFGKPIHSITIGKGAIQIFAWSQMHGNESTTTKAVFDFLYFLTQKTHFQDIIEVFLSTYTFTVIPMLNPDGSELYTRANGRGVDLNRDAKLLDQSESKLLRSLFDSLKPQLCLNLHGQRTIYGTSSNKSATVSFLAPAADEVKTITPARKQAMKSIAEINVMLQELIPGMVGRYDDTFNDNCVGDTFQMHGVPTILFEAGHYPLDYQREFTRELIFYSFLRLFGMIGEPSSAITFNDYFKIPDNEENFRDILVKNFVLEGEAEEITNCTLQFTEKLKDGAIQFVPIVSEIGAEATEFNAHKVIDCEGASILINSHENVFVGEEIVTIVGDKGVNVVFFSHI